MKKPDLKKNDSMARLIKGDCWERNPVGGRGRKRRVMGSEYVPNIL
jgi:hypothetical protein